MINIVKPVEFDWDSGNTGKNKKHGIEDTESEEAFWDADKIVFIDRAHSAAEKKFILLGKTKLEKLLYVVFTVRKKKIRIISARRINKRESNLYEKAA